MGGPSCYAVNAARYVQCCSAYLGHDKVLGVLRWICVHTLPQKLTKLLDDRVLLHEVKDGDTFHVIRDRLFMLWSFTLL